jgi:hypothetical protein
MGKTRKDALRYGNETKDKQPKRQVSNTKANKALKRLMEEDEEFGERYDHEMEISEWYDEQDY